MTKQSAVLKDDLFRQPLYRQVEEMIRKRLLSEKKPGDRLGTESELALLFGVSLVTIRGALGELAHKGLIERRRGSGTYVAERRAKARHIALWIEGDPALNGLSPSYFYMLQSLRRKLAAVGQASRPYFGFVPPRQDPGEITCTELLDDLRLDRLQAIVPLHAHPHPSWLGEVMRREIPLISWGIGSGTWTGVDYTRHFHVEADYPGAFDLALGELRARGRRRVAIIGWDGLPSDRQPILDMAQRSLSRWGFPFDPNLIHLRSHGSEKGMGWQSVREIWISAEIKPDALLITDETLFPNAVEALHDLKLKIPSDLDLALLTTDWFCENVEFPFTKVGFRIDEITNNLCDLLELVEKPQEIPKRRIVSATFLPLLPLSWTENLHPELDSAQK